MVTAATSKISRLVLVGINLYDDGLWILGWYEASFHKGEGYFVYDDSEHERWLTIDRETMRFRWLPRG